MDMAEFLDAVRVSCAGTPEVLGGGELRLVDCEAAGCDADMC